jgi:hypothetical protein
MSSAEAVSSFGFTLGGTGGLLGEVDARRVLEEFGCMIGSSSLLEIQFALRGEGDEGSLEASLIMESADEDAGETLLAFLWAKLPATENGMDLLPLVFDFRDGAGDDVTEPEGVDWGETPRRRLDVAELATFAFAETDPSPCTMATSDASNSDILAIPISVAAVLE